MVKYMRIYLDTCCYNRPYDDQSQIAISLETQAKLYIQRLIKNREFELVDSYMLRYECGQNPFEMRKKSIIEFLDNNAVLYVDIDRQAAIESMAADIMKTGIKFKDACHVASAIYAKCEYFISTDKRLLKYKTDRIRLMTPMEFVMILEGE